MIVFVVDMIIAPGYMLNLSKRGGSVIKFGGYLRGGCDPVRGAMVAG